MMNEKLHIYHSEKTNENIFYPIREKNLHKIHEYTITVEGLKYFNELKRKFIKDDSSLTSTEFANLGCLWLHYAATNNNLRGIFEWEEYIFRVGKKIDPIKAKRILKTMKLIIPNKEYDPKQMEYHDTWSTMIWRKIRERDPKSPDSKCNKCGQLIENNFYGYSNDDKFHLCMICNL